MVASVLLAAGLLATAVNVRGTATCPSPQAVATRLHDLLGDAPAATSPSTPDEARLASDNAGLHVALVHPDGRLAGSSTIAGVHGCDELADAAAVVIASWQSDAGRAAPALTLAPSADAHPTALFAKAQPLAPPGARWDLGAGLGFALAGTAIVPAAVATASLYPGGRPIGGWATAAVTGQATLALPDGSALWRRSLLAIGPALRARGPRLTLDGRVGGAAAVLSLAGQGFSTNVSHRDVTFGAMASARLSWNGANPHPWLALDATAWPRRSVLYEAPSGAESALPRLQLILTLGMAWGG